MTYPLPNAPRPRRPDQGRSLLGLDRDRGPAVILTILGVTALLVVAMAVLVVAARADDTDDTTPEAVVNLPDLPLTLDTIGFDGGTTEPASDDEGPQSAGFCNNVPAADGLLDWHGNRLTQDDDRLRVAQTLSLFQSSIDATEFVAANAAALDCDRWETSGPSGSVQFSAGEVTPAEIFGDETKEFALTAQGDGPDLFLRIVLVRRGQEVAQFTIVSANRQDLERLDAMLVTATSELGY